MRKSRHGHEKWGGKKSAALHQSRVIEKKGAHLPRGGRELEHRYHWQKGGKKKRALGPRKKGHHLMKKKKRGKRNSPPQRRRGKTGTKVSASGFLGGGENKSCWFHNLAFSRGRREELALELIGQGSSKLGEEGSKGSSFWKRKRRTSEKSQEKKRKNKKGKRGDRTFHEEKKGRCLFPKKGVCNR